jgi:hypothetical protein
LNIKRKPYDIQWKSTRTFYFYEFSIETSTNNKKQSKNTIDLQCKSKEMMYLPFEPAYGLNPTWRHDGVLFVQKQWISNRRTFNAHCKLSAYAHFMSQHYSTFPSLLETSARAILLASSFASLQAASSSFVQKLG